MKWAASGDSAVKQTGIRFLFSITKPRAAPLDLIEDFGAAVGVYQPLTLIGKDCRKVADGHSTRRRASTFKSCCH
jgi:hypothetical protein